MNERAAVVLRLAGVEGWAGERLLFLFGEALILAGDGYRAEGRDVLSAAIARYPDSPLAAPARVLILSELAKERQPIAAKQVSAALANTWDGAQRGQVLLWFAMDGLRRGETSRAVLDLQAAVEQSELGPLQILARYALAVALDLDYRTTEALPLATIGASARYGNRGEQGVLELPLADVLSESEEFYFRALAAYARSVSGAEAGAATGALQESQLMWMTFLLAVDEQHPWRTRAQYHLRRAKEALRELVPSKPAQDDDPDWILRLEKEEQEGGD